jgi:cytochrome b561
LSARNGPDSFGWVTRTIHWLMAVAILGMLAFGLYIEDMEPAMSNLWMYSAHKSVGLILLTLVLLRLIWHRITPPPPILTKGVAPWQLSLARAVHPALYLLMLAIPLTGWIASSASGLDVMIFDRWRVPSIAPVSEAWETTFFALHGILTKLLMGLLVLHAGGAILRHLHGDRTLRRMVGR